MLIITEKLRNFNRMGPRNVLILGDYIINGFSCGVEVKNLPHPNRISEYIYF